MVWDQLQSVYVDFTSIESKHRFTDESSSSDS